MKTYNRAGGWLSNQTKPYVENSEANEPSSFVVNTYDYHRNTPD